MSDKEIRKLPKRFGTKEEALSLLRAAFRSANKFSDKEAIQVNVKFKFRQWDKVKKRWD